MNILLTGGTGQLGQELQKHRSYLAPSHKELDIVDPDSVAKYFGKNVIDLIIHSAAYTDTLKPDNNAEEAVKCWRTNVIGTRNFVAQATCPIIYISTESAIEPYNFYILTKMQGEQEVKLHKYGYTIIRTSFRSDPFEYPRAPIDMYTIAGTVADIAPIIDQEVNVAPTNTTIYRGMKVKTVYELAKETRPDVIGLPRADIFNRLPECRGLLDV